MKKIIFSTMIASLLAFVGCQNEELVSDNNTENGNGKKVTLTATIAGAANSRVVLNEVNEYDEEYGKNVPSINVNWEESDEKFKVYGLTESGRLNGNSPTWFKQKKGTNQFEGTLPEPANGYFAVYGDDLKSTDMPVQYFLNEQDGTLYQRNEDYSTVLMYAEFSNSSPSITFQHMTAILKPTFKVDGKVDGETINNTITQIVMGGVNTPTTANLSLEEITIAPTSPATTLGEDIYIHLPSMEGYSAEHEFTFTVTAGGNEYTGSLTIPTGKSIEAGKLYTATIELTEVLSAEYIWKSGITASESVEGEGTEASPYLIHSANDLQWMINQVNTNGVTGKYFQLTHNLEIDSEEGATWTPIGTASRPFVGNFDGGGYTISGEMVTASDVVDAGFFGYVGVGTVITNLTNAANVTSLAHNLEKCYVGGIVGFAIGYDAAYSKHNSTYIIACHNTGTITNGTGMTEYSATGGIAGGIFNGTCVLACSNTGNLVGNDPDNNILVGGIVGLGECNYTCPSVVSCWTDNGVIVGCDYGVTLNHNRIELNYSTDSNYSGEPFYISAFTEEVVNGGGGLNYYISLFNMLNYDYTDAINAETKRDINCYWHWELENGSVVLKSGELQ